MVHFLLMDSTFTCLTQIVLFVLYKVTKSDFNVFTEARLGWLIHSSVCLSMTDERLCKVEQTGSLKVN